MKLQQAPTVHVTTDTRGRKRTDHINVSFWRFLSKAAACIKVENEAVVGIIGNENERKQVN